MKNLLAKKDIKEKIKIALKEDFGRYGDITSKVLISKKTKIKASIVAKENAIVCGTEFAVQTFKALNSKIKIKVLKKVGSKVVKGNKIIDVNGDAQSILIAERTALNFLGFMSGIATKTRKFVDIAAPYGVKIYSTRKTIAGMRQIQKYALTIGGAHVNRASLSDFYFIKDNHLGNEEGIVENIKKIKKSKLKRKITVEIDNLNQLKKIIGLKFDRILFDNMKTNTIKTAVKLFN